MARGSGSPPPRIQPRAATGGNVGSGASRDSPGPVGRGIFVVRNPHRFSRIVDGLALATAEPVDAAPAATPAARWASDCSMVLDAKKLAAGLGDADVRSPPPSAALGERSRWDGAASGRGLLSAERGLDLWSLLFSRAFSELGEGILQSSLEHIRADVEARLTTVLGYIVAGPFRYR